MLPVMIAVFALLLVSQYFLFKNKPNTTGNRPTQTAESSANGPESAATPAAAAPETTSSTTAAPAKAAAAESETVIDNDLYRIVFTNRGAQAKSWVLKKYKDDRGQPLDLVNHESANLGLPLSLFAYDDALRAKVNSALYVASRSVKVAAPGELSFEFSDGTVAVHKTI